MIIHNRALKVINHRVSDCSSVVRTKRTFFNSKFDQIALKLLNLDTFSDSKTSRHFTVNLTTKLTILDYHIFSEIAITHGTRTRDSDTRFKSLFIKLVNH